MTPLRSASGAPGILFVLAMSATAACTGGDTVDSGFEDLGGEGGTSGVGGSSTGTSTGTATSTGSATGTGTGTGTGGAGGTLVGGNGPSCDDNGPGEPNNDNEASALDLGDVDDDDGDGGSVPGFVFEGDQDWFVYFGVDNFPGVADPTVTFSSSDPLRACQFIQCPDNDESFSCPGGTIDANSPEGRIGCCGTVGFAIDDFKCGSSPANNDSATIYLRIDDPTDMAECASYTLGYHF